MLAVPPNALVSCLKVEARALVARVRTESVPARKFLR
jgi:hypothetical protein